MTVSLAAVAFTVTPLTSVNVVHYIYSPTVMYITRMLPTSTPTSATIQTRTAALLRLCESRQLRQTHFTVCNTTVTASVSISIRVTTGLPR